MAIRKIVSRIKSKLFLFFRKENELIDNSQKCENLTSLPGIGLKNCQVFFEAGYKTPESIIAAADKDLMALPGVGIAFIKKLREQVGRV